MQISGTAVVTGGSSGIGYRICESLGKAGVDIIVADLTADPRSDIPPIAEAFESLDAQLTYVETDVTDEKAVENMFGVASKEYGGISALVNNAGVTEFGSVTDTSGEQWEQVLDINLTGVFHCCKHGVPLLADQPEASIVNVGSIYGMLGGVSNFGYTATKGGVIAITRQLAAEYGPDGIRTNAVLPGFIRTEMLAEDTPEVAQDMALNRTPVKRLGDPREVADAVRFLVSDDASYINGQIIAVDGGFSTV